MSYIVRSNAALPKPKAWTVNQPVVSPAEKQRQRIPTRRAEITWLTQDGQVENKTCFIPAMPVFQDAMSAMAQGALVQTPTGPVAIEDLEPGMEVCTADGENEVIQWIGSMTIFPNAADLSLPQAMLYRVTDGGYGLDRSAPDLMLGPSARLLPGLSASDSASPLHNISGLADGYSVIEIRPMSAVRVFHISLKNHRLLRVNGVLVESYHPGAEARLNLSREMFPIFMGIFPHMTSEGDFGPQNHKRSAPTGV